MNIGSLLPRHARYRPDHLAFVFKERRLTYSAFNREVNRLSNALLAKGLKKGDHIFTTLSNSFELMALYWTAAKTGLVIVPASTLLQASGLKSLIRDSDAVMVFADAAFADMLADMRDDLNAVRDDGYVLVGQEGAVPTGFQTFDDLVSDASDSEPPDAHLNDDDVYNIMYTSGTTGAPKGIIHTHYVRAFYCTTFSMSFRISPESIILHAGSIVFNGAMLDLMPWMYVGCTYILHPAFDAGKFLKTLEQEKVTHIVLVPAQIIEILNHPDYDPAKLDHLEMVLSVGARQSWQDRRLSQ